MTIDRRKERLPSRGARGPDNFLKDARWLVRAFLVFRCTSVVQAGPSDEFLAIRDPIARRLEDSGQLWYSSAKDDVLGLRRCRVTLSVSSSCQKDHLLYAERFSIHEGVSSFVLDGPTICKKVAPSNKLPRACRFRCGDPDMEKEKPDKFHHQDSAPMDLLHIIWDGNNILFLGQLCQLIRKPAGAGNVVTQPGGSAFMGTVDKGFFSPSFATYQTVVQDVVGRCTKVPDDESSWYDGAFVDSALAKDTLKDKCGDGQPVYIADSYGFVHVLPHDAGSDVTVLVNEADRDRNPVVWFCASHTEFQGWLAHTTYFKDFSRPWHVVDSVGHFARVSGPQLHATKLRRDGDQLHWTLIRCGSSELEYLRTSLFTPPASALNSDVAVLLDDGVGRGNATAPQNCAWNDDPTIDRCRDGDVWVKIGDQAHKLSGDPSAFLFGGTPRGIELRWVCGSGRDGLFGDDAERVYLEYANMISAVNHDGVIIWFGFACDFKVAEDLPRVMTEEERSADEAAITQTWASHGEMCKSYQPRYDAGTFPTMTDVGAAYIDRCRDVDETPMYFPDAFGRVKVMRGGDSGRVYLPQSPYFMGAKHFDRGVPFWCGSNVLFAALFDHSDHSIADFLGVRRDSDGIVHFEMLSCPPEVMLELRRARLRLGGSLIV